MDSELIGDAGNPVSSMDLSRTFCESAARTHAGIREALDRTPPNMQYEGGTFDREAFIEKACPADASQEELQRRGEGLEDMNRRALPRALGLKSPGV